MAVKVGSFAKSTNTSVPVDQAITGVGFTPKVVYLFTSGQTETGTADNYLLAFGTTTGALNSYSIATASQDAQDTSNVSQRNAAKALTVVQWGESTLAECDLKSFDSDGFTVTWTTNDANAYLIGYVALGGTSLTNAKIVRWTMPTSTGDKAVTGAGFQPDCVHHFWTACTNEGSIAGQKFGIGWMDTGPTEDAQSIAADDNAGTSNTRKAAAWTDPIAGITSAGANDFGTTNTYSFDADGFTVNFDNAAAAEYVCYSLCMKGGSYSVDRVQMNFNNDYTVTTGFQSEGVLFVSSGTTSSTDTDAVTARFSIGASAGTDHRVAFAYDQSAQATTNTASYFGDTLSLYPADTETGYVSTWNATSYVIDCAGSALYYGSALAFAFGTVATGNPWYAYAQQ